MLPTSGPPALARHDRPRGGYSTGGGSCPAVCLSQSCSAISRRRTSAGCSGFMCATMFRVCSEAFTSSVNQVGRGNNGFLNTVRPFSLSTIRTRSPKVVIRTVGRGPALGVDLAITFEGPGERREWSEASIVPDEAHELKLPEPFRTDLDATLEQPLSVHVGGRMEDLYSRQIDVNTRIDVSEWWAKIAAADERVAGRKKVPGDPG